MPFNASAFATVADLDAVFQAERATDPTAKVMATSTLGPLGEKFEEKIADLPGLHPCGHHFVRSPDCKFAQHWGIRSAET